MYAIFSKKFKFVTHKNIKSDIMALKNFPQLGISTHLRYKLMVKF